ncbi:OTU deubiquitinase with linear linkage specificity a [Brachionichthys hirsutus]|uniref:OTU deubiquitinase with linear linkage specificity a n=1 Tax=Brachionichthys hirsutus TaxID=412623 RepID=UPI003604EAD6
MAWVKSVSDSGGDVFDENADDLKLMSKEWSNNMKRRHRDGFVDGAGVGEDSFLQVGFKMGFLEGAALTAAVGRLKGILSALSCWCRIQHPESPIPASLSDLLREVSLYEDSIVDGLGKALENPPPSVSSISDSVEDLEVKQEEPGCRGEECKEANCCRGGEKMDLDVPQQQPKPRCGFTNCSFSRSENLNHLVQRCTDLVSELGLPQELIGHIQELKNI